MAYREPKTIDVRSRKKASYGLAVLRDRKYRSIRARTVSGRAIYNCEIIKVKRALDRFGIKYSSLPKSLKIC